MQLMSTQFVFTKHNSKFIVDTQFISSLTLKGFLYDIKSLPIFNKNMI